MEERLDDAINVLRNHCEPQMGITNPNLDNSSFIGGHQVNATPTSLQHDSHDNPPVKLERISNAISANNNSTYLKGYKSMYNYSPDFIFSFRKTKGANGDRYSE
jgi:hypothetical protein